jgi:hypothetical protein
LCIGESQSSGFGDGAGNFLRRRIKHQLVERDFGTALVKALDLAKSSDAKSLPGWSGAEPSAK